MCSCGSYGISSLSCPRNGVQLPPSPQMSFSTKYAALGRSRSTLLMLHRFFTAISPNHSSLT